MSVKGVSYILFMRFLLKGCFSGNFKGIDKIKDDEDSEGCQHLLAAAHLSLLFSTQILFKFQERQYLGNKSGTPE